MKDRVETLNSFTLKSGCHQAARILWNRLLSAVMPQDANQDYGLSQMIAIVYLIPISLFLGVLSLTAFWWCLRDDQFDDLEGDSYRVLDDSDDLPLK